MSKGQLLYFNDSNGTINYSNAPNTSNMYPVWNGTNWSCIDVPVLKTDLRLLNDCSIGIDGSLGSTLVDK